MPCRGGVPEYDLTCTEMTCDDADCGEHASAMTICALDLCSCDTALEMSFLTAQDCVDNHVMLEFTEGVIGDTSGDYCSDNIALTAVNDNSCDLTCDEGYKSSGTAKVTCSLDGGSCKLIYAWRCHVIRDCGDHAHCNEGDR